MRNTRKYHLRTKREKPLPQGKSWEDRYIYRDKHPDFDRTWEDHKKLVYKTAYILSREYGIRKEDLYGTLVFKLNYLLYSYDPSKGKLSTLFWSHIRHFIQEAFLRHDSESRDLSYFMRYRSDEAKRGIVEFNFHEAGNNFLFYRVPEKDDDWAASIVDEFSSAKECWDFFTKGMHPRWREVLEAVYSADMNFTEVAECLGLSRERIRQIHNQALDYIRSRLEKVTDWFHLFAKKPE